MKRKKVTNYQPRVRKPRKANDFIARTMREEDLDELANELIKWAQKPTSLVFSEFFTDQYIAPSTIAGYIPHHTNLRIAMEIARYMISARRERGALTGDLNANVVMRMMHVYNPEYAAAERERQALRHEAEERAAQPPVIVLERYPSSDLVPVKETL